MMLTTLKIVYRKHTNGAFKQCIIILFSDTYSSRCELERPNARGSAPYYVRIKPLKRGKCSTTFPVRYEFIVENSANKINDRSKTLDKTNTTM